MLGATAWCAPHPKPHFTKRYHGYAENERKKVDSRGFIDGDLIESYLDLIEEQRKEVAKEMNMEIEELSQRVEEYARLH